jgi:sulfate permease, SulP family
VARGAGPVSLRGYQVAWLRGDLLAGITVAAFLVPQVMAYAQVAGVPPVAGLWAALPALVIYAALGSSRSLSMGPESTTALMTAVAIGPLAAGSPAVCGAGGVACLAGGGAVGVRRGGTAGFAADLLSRPVLVGYLAGVGLIMIAGQLGRVTGVRVSGSSVAAAEAGTYVPARRPERHPVTHPPAGAGTRAKRPLGPGSRGR